jgi:hypothetical protein
MGVQVLRYYLCGLAYMGTTGILPMAMELAFD